jgi:O-acetyl-ADP-ribose deacetylase (regulator of RNase III)
VLDRGKPGGISATILWEAGDSVVREISKHRKIGSNVITRAGKLPYNYIIHCVCPRWENGYDSRRKTKCLEDLCSTVKKGLEAACLKGINSVGLPPIGSGEFSSKFVNVLGSDDSFIKYGKLLCAK